MARGANDNYYEIRFADNKRIQLPLDDLTTKSRTNPSISVNTRLFSNQNVFKTYLWGEYVRHITDDVGNVWHLHYTPVGNGFNIQVEINGETLINTSRNYEDKYIDFDGKVVMWWTCDGSFDPSLMNLRYVTLHIAPIHAYGYNFREKRPPIRDFDTVHWVNIVSDDNQTILNSYTNIEYNYLYHNFEPDYYVYPNKVQNLLKIEYRYAAIIPEETGITSIIYSYDNEPKSFNIGSLGLDARIPVSKLIKDGRTPIHTTASSSTDPYNPGGESAAGGGGGTFSRTDTEIETPDVPDFNVIDTGFIRMYNPTTSELSDLSDFMWSDLFDLDTVKKLFGSPMEAILGLTLIPFQPTISSSKYSVSLAGVNTGVSMHQVTEQFVKVDLGSVSLSEYWGSFMDYEPYTHVDIYLPYIGIQQLSTDDVMNKTVNVTYMFDTLSGGCTAFITANNHVLYQFTGQCAASIPVTGKDMTNVINGVMSIAGSVVGAIATGGATAPTAIASVANNVVNNLKPSIQKSGSMSGAGGMLGIQFPYFIITQPRQSLPTNQNGFKGYPCNISVKLSDITGYTEIDSIHLAGFSTASEAELTELETLLKEGVIF